MAANARTWAGKAAYGAVEAFQDAWVEDHDGTRAPERTAKAIGRAITSHVSKDIGQAEARSLIVDAAETGRPFDLWCRAAHVRTGQRPLADDCAIAAQKILELLADEHPYDLVVWAAEMAGSENHGRVDWAYRKVVIGRYQSGLDPAVLRRQRAAVEALATARGLVLSRREVETLAASRRYELRWLWDERVLAPASEREMARAAADVAQADVAAERAAATEVWASLSEEERARWTRQALLNRGWGGMPWYADLVLGDAQALAARACGGGRAIGAAGPVALLGMGEVAA